MGSPNNPPAFPNEWTGKTYRDGMTLRDWFAGQFALIAGATGLGKDNELRGGDAAKIAAAAYELADAMLAERERGQ